MLPARGNYSDLAANVASLLDGEFCYAIDQDQYYQKEGSVLVSVGATKAQGNLADSALQDAPSNGSEYVRKNGSWSVATGGGGGGIEEAPNDGTPYSRQSEGWVSSPAGLGDAPSDGNHYGRQNGGWAQSPSGLTDAPTDGSPYSRQDGGWVASSTGLSDAASDGTLYGRQDGSWVEVPTTSGIEEAPNDGQQYARQNTGWEIVNTGSGGVAGVSSIIAGTGISIDQSLGDVTITNTVTDTGATNLGELTDVDLTVAATDGQVLAYDNASSTFKPVEMTGADGVGATSLDELSDVDLSTPATIGDVLMYDGSDFTPFAADQIPNSLGAQPRVTFTINADGVSAYLFSGPGFPTQASNPEIALQRGQTYVFSNVSGSHPFEIQTAGGASYDSGVTDNNTIGDVVFVVPMNAPDELKYQCTAHGGMTGVINVLNTVDASTPSLASSDLTDVSSTSAQSGEVLVHDGSQYVPTALGLDGLDDVNLTVAATDGQALTYDVASGKWIAQTPAGGGLADAASDGTLYGRQDGAWVEVPSGGGGSSGPAFTEVTVSPAEILLAHTFEGVSGDAGLIHVNMASWNGPQGSDYGYNTPNFFDLRENTVTTTSGTWGASADQGLHIQFDFRTGLNDGAVADGSYIFGIGTGGGGDGVSSAFSIHWAPFYGNSLKRDDRPEDAQSCEGVVYLRDDNATGADNNYLVGTMPINTAKTIADGAWYQITFIVHTDETGAQNGKFSCYLNGKLVDSVDRSTPNSNGESGGVITGGAGFDTYYFGARRDASETTLWHQINNFYIAGKETCEFGTDGIEYFISSGSDDTTLISQRSFKTYTPTGPTIALTDVSSQPPTEYGHVMCFDPDELKYVPQPAFIVRDYNNSDYLYQYPYINSATIFDHQGVGNLIIDGFNGKIAVWTGDPDFDSGAGGWMEWNISPIFGA